MSKKDYETLAKILSHWILPVGLIGEICDWLEKDNPQFNRKLFIDATMEL